MSNVRPVRPPFEWALMVVACTLAVINLGLGATLVFGMPSRTSGASFDQIRDFLAIPYWGVLFIITGTFALVGQAVWWLRLVRACHFVAGLACLFWSIAFVSGLSNPNVSGTGIWAYAGLAGVHLTVAATARRP